MALIAIVCTVGFYCAWRTRDTGYHTAEVRQLKRLLSSSPAAAKQFCASLREEEERCLQIVQVITPDPH
jgi:hypothetical protein